MNVLQMVRFATVGPSEAVTVEGHRADGSPIVRFEPVWRDRGEIFATDAETARTLIARGAAKNASLAGKVAALAEATLHAGSPLAAALAGLTVRGILTWHAVLGDGGHWQPAPDSIGPTRGSFEARFASEAEVAAHWAEAEASIPHFSFMVEEGFRRAFIWRNAALLEIPTQITRF